MMCLPTSALSHTVSKTLELVVDICCLCDVVSLTWELPMACTNIIQIHPKCTLNKCYVLKQNYGTCSLNPLHCFQFHQFGIKLSSAGKDDVSSKTPDVLCTYKCSADRHTDHNIDSLSHCSVKPIGIWYILVFNHEILITCCWQTFM